MAREYAEHCADELEGKPLDRALLERFAGEETIHVDQMFGRRASLDFLLHPAARVEAAPREAGLGEVEAVARDPYPGVEHPTRRACVFARKPELTQ